MNYSEAISVVGEGLYAWRGAWPSGWYIHAINTGDIYLYRGTDGAPYEPSEADESALDWDSGDHPPKGK